MQFREQGRRVQVLTYRGYDRVKKRAIVKLVGSFDNYSGELSDGLLDKLTDDEKTELQSHIKNIRQSRDMKMRQYSVSALAQSIRNVSDSLSDSECANRITEAYASEIYEAIDSLTKALRKLGYRRSKASAPQSAA